MTNNVQTPGGNTTTAGAVEQLAVRYHRKRDGILRIEPDGRARFLTLFERLRYFFGAKP